MIDGLGHRGNDPRPSLSFFFNRYVTYARLLAAFVGLLLVVHAHAQDYPTRQVRVLEPLAAASAVDVVARLVADRLSQELGQGFYVDNQPGAAGLLGMRSGMKAAPDGYTLLAVNDSTVTILPNIRSDAGYDPRRDFTPISLLARLRWVLVVNPALGVNDVQEFIAYAKAHPGMNYGSGGQGSPQHLAMELFMRATGVQMTHVPYRGVIQAFTDVAAGQIPAMFIALPAPLKLADTGQVKIIGFAEKQRLATLPTVPTIDEQGVTGFEYTSWAALLGPKGLPEPIVAKLNAAIRKVMAAPDVRAKLIEYGDLPVGSTPDELRAVIAQDFASKAELIKAANIHAD